MTGNMRRLACLFITLLNVGCSREEMLQKFSSSDDQKIAAGYIDRLRSRDFDAIVQAMDPSVRVPDLRGTLEKMATILPNEKEQSVKLVGAQRFQSTDSVTVNTSFEYAFRGQWILANVAVRSAGGKNTIVGFNVYPEAQSLEETNRFTLAGRGAAQYSVLCAAIAAFLLSVYALIACARTKTSRRKWPWVVFILIGFGRLAVNWTTGALSFTPIHFSLLSAGAFAPLYGAWTIAVGLPIGAILFLVYGRKRLAMAAQIASGTGNVMPPK